MFPQIVKLDWHQLLLLLDTELLKSVCLQAGVCITQNKQI